MASLLDQTAASLANTANLSSTTATAPPPSSSSSRDAAIKTRIITHMNTDHQSSLQNYIQHYNRVPASKAHDAQLEDMTLNHLIIRSSAGRHIIPLDPPMTSLLEARERSVKMHHDSLSGLGLSDLKITSYRLPSGLLGWGMGILTLWATPLLISSHNFQPGGSLFYDRVLSPYAPEWLINLIRMLRLPILFGVIIGLHAAEAVYLQQSRLRKYNVEVGSRVWLMWIATVLLTGFPTFARFDEMVKEIEGEKKGDGKGGH